MLSDFQYIIKEDTKTQWFYYNDNNIKNNTKLLVKFIHFIHIFLYECREVHLMSSKKATIGADHDPEGQNHLNNVFYHRYC